MNRILLLVLSSSIAIFSCKEGGARRCYILNQKVFNEFKATKIRQSEMEKVQERQRAVLDSIFLVMKGLREGPALQEQRKLYNNLADEFSRQNEELSAYHSEGLWMQINQYIRDYGREHKLEFIYGADGSGAIMYADTTLDRTNEIIQYINKRYEGE